MTLLFGSLINSRKTFKQEWAALANQAISARRRHWPCRDQHWAQWPHGPASRTAARCRELVASGGNRDIVTPDIQFSGIGRGADGAQADDGHGAPAGGGNELCRRILDFDRAIHWFSWTRRYHAASAASRSDNARSLK